MTKQPHDLFPPGGGMPHPDSELTAQTAQGEEEVPTPDGAFWNTIELLASRFSAHDTELGLCQAEQWTLQVLKISEETGEAAQAVVGVRGTNPRKERTEWEQVHAEVADVTITSMVALARMRSDAGSYLRRQLALKAAKFLNLPASAHAAAPAQRTRHPQEPGEPSGVAVMLLNDAGEYLLHLRDTTPGIDDPGLFSFIRGGRRDQESPAEAMARELDEEVDLAVPDLRPYRIIPSPGPGGTVRGWIQVFVGTWNGDAHTLPIHEGILCRWFAGSDVGRLPICSWTADVIASHYAHATATAASGVSRPPSTSPEVRH
ncbi:NUDIX domain-containing protein [Streptomyces sp. V3I7]|uniref:NUDIX domain-containing protein n=1 Tax=Streptomyces sp. V3I7 TaxID=3042278 RepID=UPI002789CB58|nr:NUDIX domain-containing protein [Streptomyces sp. V3I7]MDQ0989654.1 8-oxo-dGTP pyrophosphatase MutT (NUDIX family)/NTP pyrophosphatase (non-canonical NTP hydrolase) [Streptomyces sp. V3I7]